MTDYTPTTEDVRERYRYFDGGPFPEDGPDFDRWLEEHDRQVAEKAHDEGFTACANWWEIHHFQSVISEMNPYRKEES